jgi:hypothetical protein
MSTPISRRRFQQAALFGLGGLLTTRFAPTGYAWADEQSATEAPAAPLPFVDGSFTVVALPDTQNYCERFPDHYHKQTQWIAENKDKHNIRFVVHLGDITNRNTPDQWAVARKAMHTLDGVVPYSLLPGNHDLGPGGNAATRDTMLNEYFVAADIRKQPGFGGLLDEKRLENGYYTFKGGEREFLVLALEWGPREEVVQWADEIVGKHPQHAVVLTTHAYMFNDDTRYDWAKYGKKQTWNPHEYATSKLPGGVNDGQQLWEKLVSKHKNFVLTLNGHVLGDGQARLTSTTDHGNQVHQVLANYQMIKEGGEGYLRLVEFLPDGETLQFKSYSPSRDAYKTDEQNQFVLNQKIAATG